jgi:hypothetical protein
MTPMTGGAGGGAETEARDGLWALASLTWAMAGIAVEAADAGVAPAPRRGGALAVLGATLEAIAGAGEDAGPAGAVPGWNPGSGVPTVVEPGRGV